MAGMRRYSIIMAVFVLIALIACGQTQRGGGTPESGTIRIMPRQFESVTGIQWQLTGMTADGKAIDLIKDTQNTISFDENGKVAGVATINRYFGGLNLQENGDIIWNKAFGMTRMAGPPDFMAQETALMEALTRTSRMYLQGSILTLVDEKASTRLEFTRSSDN